MPPEGLLAPHADGQDLAALPGDLEDLLDAASGVAEGEQLPPGYPPGAYCSFSGGIVSSCGLTPRRRRQPGSGAARAEPVFPPKREGPARRRSRHAMVVEALVPPGAARVAIRIATRVATVYTNAPKRCRGARSSHLCTLLRSQGHPQPKPTAQQCTQTPQNGAERPFTPICVHSCVPTSVYI